MKTRLILSMILVIVAISVAVNEIDMNIANAFLSQSSRLSSISLENQSEEWMSTFDLEACTFSTLGSNEYFILRPGYKVTLESQDKSDNSRLIVTVLNETKVINGIETRVVEEKKTEGGAKRNFKKLFRHL